jgi:hypothetical protein
MIRIRRYFEIPFSEPGISGEELRIFTEDHLGKLNSNNNSGPLAGTLTAMVDGTQAAFAPFDNALSSRAEQIGTQMGGTLSKDDAVRLFKTAIRQRRGRVVDKVGENSAIYLEIFPGGLMYYTSATMQTIEARLDYAVDKFTKYSAELGPELAAEFTTLRSTFKNARSGQVEEKGEVSEARQAVRTTRTALELQLTENLLSLAKQFIGEPARATQFFNQSLLEDPQQAPPPPAPPNG